MIYTNQFNEVLPPNIGQLIASQQPVLCIGSAIQLHVKGAKRPASAVLSVQENTGKSCQHAGQAVMQIVERLKEPLSESQFKALCASLQVKDEAAIEWGLGYLGMCGFLNE